MNEQRIDVGNRREYGERESRMMNARMARLYPSRLKWLLRGPSSITEIYYLDR